MSQRPMEQDNEQRGLKPMVPMSLAGRVHSSKSAATVRTTPINNCRRFRNRAKTSPRRVKSATSTVVLRGLTVSVHAKLPRFRAEQKHKHAQPRPMKIGDNLWANVRYASVWNMLCGRADKMVGVCMCAG